MAPPRKYLTDEDRKLAKRARNQNQYQKRKAAATKAAKGSSSRLITADRYVNRIIYTTLASQLETRM